VGYENDVVGDPKAAPGVHSARDLGHGEGLEMLTNQNYESRQKETAFRDITKVVAGT
jgi:hypothetical protein